MDKKFILYMYHITYENIHFADNTQNINVDNITKLHYVIIKQYIWDSLYGKNLSQLHNLTFCHLFIYIFFLY